MKRTTAQRSGRKVNVAVVGLGFMGVTHIKAYQQAKAARLVAVCDAVRLPVNGILPGVAGNITGSGALDLGRNIKVFRELADLLADPEVELVDICVPTPYHPEQAIASLKAGKHVLCEKPLALTPAQARGIVKAAKSACGFFMPAMCMRFWPGWSWLKAVVDKKIHGKVQAVSLRRVSPSPSWSKAYSNGKLTGGALLDMHIHDTDFVQFLFGIPDAVTSSGLIRGKDSIDHVVTQYHFRSGPVVHAEGSWLLNGNFNMSYTMFCERATLDYNLARGADALQVAEAGKPAKTVKCKGPDGYSGEIGYMLQSILTGKAPKVVTAEDGLKAVEICDAEAKSVRTGRTVAL